MIDISFDLSIAMFISFFSTLVQSLTGFGLAIVSTPLFLTVYDAKQVVLILQLICAVINIFFAFILRRDIDYPFLKTLFIGSIIGQPIGLFIFCLVPGSALKILVSVIILVFLFIMHFNKKAMAETTVKTAGTGFLSGVLNTATSMSGPPLILYLMNLHTDKTAMRATCIAYFALTNICAVAIFLFNRIDLSFALEQAVYLLPCCFAGLWAGNKLFPYLSQKMFNRIIFTMLLFSALYTLFSAL